MTPYIKILFYCYSNRFHQCINIIVRKIINKYIYLMSYSYEEAKK